MYEMVERILPFAQWGDGWAHGPWMMGWSMMAWFGPIMMFIFLAVLIIALILFIRWITASMGGRTKADDSALEILKKRYARGEIGKEEFEAKKKDLT